MLFLEIERGKFGNGSGFLWVFTVKMHFEVGEKELTIEKWEEETHK